MTTGANKILTVSYGAFSCTLEGFEDPFNTMKGIAEYFRDLAADDRYFGAEPPQPDAAMLHQIAQRTVQRGVSTQVSENTVVLRAQAPQPEPVAEPVPKPAPVLHAAMPDGVSAKLARLRQAVVAPQSYEASAPIITPTQGGDSAKLTDLNAQMPFLTAIQTHLPEVARLESMAYEEAQRHEQAHTHTVTPSPYSEELSADEIGILLSAINHDANSDLIADLNDVVAAETIPTSDAPSLAQCLSELIVEHQGSLERIGLVEPVEDHSEGEPEAEIADDSQASAIDVVPDTMSLDQQEDDGLGTVNGGDAVNAPQPLDEISLDQLEEDADLEDAEVAPTQAAEVEDASSPVVMADDVAGPHEEPSQTPFFQTEALATALDTRIQRARARVIKVNRAEAEPRELQAEFADHTPSAAENMDNGGAARAPLGAATASVDEVARLLKQADEEMSEPESKRRHAAIQHLKAAVAATLASRRRGGNPQGAADAPVPEVSAPAEPVVDATVKRPAPLVLVSEQRIDQVSTPHDTVPHVMPVRPRRVGGGMTASATALILQSEHALAPEANAALLQALDLSTAEDDLDEVDAEDASDLADIIEQSGDFMDFAARLGVKELPELLEAAAAYATCIEKRETFSRPLLMRRVISSDLSSTFSREDGLRSFGSLLRDGRFARIRRGQYALSQDSQILHEAQKLARA